MEFKLLDSIALCFKKNAIKLCFKKQTMKLLFYLSNEFTELTRYLDPRKLGELDPNKLSAIDNKILDVQR